MNDLIHKGLAEVASTEWCNLRQAILWRVYGLRPLPPDYAFLAESQYDTKYGFTNPLNNGFNKRIDKAKEEIYLYMQIGKISFRLPPGRDGDIKKDLAKLKCSIFYLNHASNVWEDPEESAIEIFTSDLMATFPYKGANDADALTAPAPVEAEYLPSEPLTTRGKPRKDGLMLAALAAIISEREAGFVETQSDNAIKERIRTILELAGYARPPGKTTLDDWGVLKDVTQAREFYDKGIQKSPPHPTKGSR